MGAAENATADQLAGVLYGKAAFIEHALTIDEALTTCTVSDDVRQAVLQHRPRKVYPFISLVGQVTEIRNRHEPAIRGSGATEEFISEATDQRLQAAARDLAQELHDLAAGLGDGGSA